MRSVVIATLTSAVLAIIAGCAQLGNHGYENGVALHSTSQPEPSVIRAKIDLQIPFDKWELTTELKSELAAFLKDLRTATRKRSGVTFGAVIVTGHTDRIGPLSYNMKISEELAEKVKDYLISTENVDPTLIFSEGMGPTQPVPVTQFCDNMLEIRQRIACLAPNRRVTVEVVGSAMVLASIATEPPGSRLAVTR